MPTPRLATRAIILHHNKLLLVNAWKGKSHLWCAPGGGVEPHASLPDNLAREVMEETGLSVEVGAVCLVNEFHDPGGTFHQVDIYFRCTILSGALSDQWIDPEGIVTQRRWVTRDELRTLTCKPDSLASVAWDTSDHITYDALEPIVR
ncbi:ADP-ribose pyrophosphatase YjhB, NUDIX family [Cognatiyoonia koreensis]|uniref:ADP-ribose pyrophosphatase YjhB, NUDIX family n=1 Tax=Cognatiyoonia koreensis TaxID=364200 RepID=A0A1I0N0A7_9RHOB|nr:NUDIX domain-containing protein [Cognatiyoonia koreensis]SEV94255.1 ADP-ribose pyrophosphatase YjhB, NUDIX family [Cognatiyoonia koreensis]